MDLKADFIVNTGKAAAAMSQFYSEQKKRLNASLASGDPAEWIKKEEANLTKSGYFSSARWKSYGKWFSVGGKEAGTSFSDAMTKQMEKELKSKATFFKDLTFMLQPLLNPTSIWGNMFAARQGFSAFATPYGQQMIGGGGATGALRATALLQGSILAVGLALLALKKSIEFVSAEIRKAFAFAHSLYGSSLTSGLGLQFMAQRKMTADVLGVPESEIFRFKQSADVMRQLSGAVGEISRDAPQLAFTSAQFKILEYNLLALGSKLATQVAPALNVFVAVMDKLVNVLSNPKITELIKALVLMGIPETYGLFVRASGDKNPATFGQPQTFMRQLPVGAFEKMGLVIGGAQNKALDYLREIAQNTKPNKGNYGNPLPRGGYGGMLSPAYNMP